MAVIQFYFNISFPTEQYYDKKSDYNSTFNNIIHFYMVEIAERLFVLLSIFCLPVYFHLHVVLLCLCISSEQPNF